MDRLYIILLGFSAISISFIGASFSIVGLSSLFAGAAIAVAFMAGALEFAKLVVAIFLHRYWAHLPWIMKTYLSVAVAILIGITSTGIFGYLSNAYQKSSLELRIFQVKLESLKTEQQNVQNELNKIRKFIEDIPTSRISQKFAFQRDAQPQIDQLTKRANDVILEIQRTNVDILTNQAKVGPLIYVAKAFSTDVDVVAKYLILVFVSVFDPLAICLVFATSLAAKMRAEEETKRAKTSTSVNIESQTAGSPSPTNRTRARRATQAS
jgi:hypothetical protein